MCHKQKIKNMEVQSGQSWSLAQRSQWTIKTPAFKADSQIRWDFVCLFLMEDCLDFPSMPAITKEAFIAFLCPISKYKKFQKMIALWCLVYSSSCSIQSAIEFTSQRITIYSTHVSSCLQQVSCDLSLSEKLIDVFMQISDKTLQLHDT